MSTESTAARITSPDRTKRYLPPQRNECSASRKPRAYGEGACNCTKCSDKMRARARAFAERAPKNRLQDEAKVAWYADARRSFGQTAERMRLEARR